MTTHQTTIYLCAIRYGDEDDLDIDCDLDDPLAQEYQVVMQEQHETFRAHHLSLERSCPGTGVLRAHDHRATRIRVG